MTAAFILISVVIALAASLSLFGRSAAVRESANVSRLSVAGKAKLSTFSCLTSQQSDVFRRILGWHGVDRSGLGRLHAWQV